MEINSVQNFTLPKTNSRKNVSFNGLRRLLNADTVDAFLKKVEVVGDVVIQKRVEEKGRLELVPTAVTLVKVQKPFTKERGNSRTFYSLFERGFRKAKSVKDLDSKELGLMELEYANLENMHVSSDVTPEVKSFIAAKKAYKEALEIDYLVSYEGDKYRGIGTRLLDIAIDVSNKLGFGGRTFLYSLNKIPADYMKDSVYCWRMQSANPTKFYFDYGFRADGATNRWIKDGYTDIKSINMYLPQKTINQKLSARKEHPLFVEWPKKPAADVKNDVKE